MTEKDMIDHPAHYNATEFEPIDVIEDWSLGYHLGCAVKYIARHTHKGKPLEDLKKARWYIDRAIAQMEKDEQKIELSVYSGKTQKMFLEILEVLHAGNDVTIVHEGYAYKIKASEINYFLVGEAVKEGIPIGEIATRFGILGERMG